MTTKTKLTDLLQKLQHYGFRGVIHDWLISYLTNRFQTTQTGKNISNKEKMLAGVPQESVLGPMFFLLYINYIQYSSTTLSFHMFADGTNLLSSNKDPKVLEKVVNTELLKAQVWLTASKLTL